MSYCCILLRGLFSHAPLAAGAASNVSLAGVVDQTSAVATDGARSLINGVKARLLASDAGSCADLLRA